MVQRSPGQVLSRNGHRAAVLGWPITHSLSPVLHGAAYRALGLDSWRYDAHEVRADGLAGFVAGLGPEWAGLSLTMPLKEAAFDVTDDVSALARDVGAVNTLVRRADGGWHADNTDVYGVQQALAEAGTGLPQQALVLGSGATARAVLAALAGLGASGVTFAVRGQARPETLAYAARLGLAADVCGLEDVPGRLGGSPLVVSTLPAGGADEVAAAVAAAGNPGQPDRGPAGPGQAVLLDVVYAGWPTPLARAFDDRGAVVVSGFEMLLHQAAAQVRLMTSLEAPVEAMRTAGLAALVRR